MAEYPSPEDRVEYGNDTFRIVDGKMLEVIDNSGRNHQEWMDTEGKDLLATAGTHLDGLSELELLTPTEHARLMGAMVAKVEARRDSIFMQPIQQLDEYARQLSYPPQPDLFEYARDRDKNKEATLREVLDHIDVRAAVETVRLYYAEEAARIDQAYQPDAHWEDPVFILSYYRLYDKALEDFGYIQAFGREIALLDAYVQWAQAQVFESAAVKDAQSRLESHKKTLRGMGLQVDQVEHVVRLARQALPNDNWQRGNEDLRNAAS